MIGMQYAVRDNICHINQSDWKLIRFGIVYCLSIFHESHSTHGKHSIYGWFTVYGLTPIWIVPGTRCPAHTFIKYLTYAAIYSHLWTVWLIIPCIYFGITVNCVITYYGLMYSRLFTLSPMEYHPNRYKLSIIQYKKCIFHARLGVNRKLLISTQNYFKWACDFHIMPLIDIHKTRNNCDKNWASS